MKPTGVGVDGAGHVIVADTASFPNSPDHLSEGPHLLRFTADGRY